MSDGPISQSALRALAAERQRLAVQQSKINKAFNEGTLSPRQYALLSRRIHRGLPPEEYANLLERHIARGTEEARREKDYRHAFKARLPATFLITVILALVLSSVGMEWNALVTYTARTPGQSFDWASSIPDTTVRLGDQVTLNLSGYIANPQGIPLKYTIKKTEGVSATEAESIDGLITLTPEAEGEYHVLVYAGDGTRPGKNSTFILKVVGASQGVAGNRRAPAPVTLASDPLVLDPVYSPADKMAEKRFAIVSSAGKTVGVFDIVGDLAIAGDVAYADPVPFQGFMVQDRAGENILAINDTGVLRLRSGMHIHELEGTIGEGMPGDLVIQDKMNNTIAKIDSSGVYLKGVLIQNMTFK